jgi:hypothetical protein
MPLVPSRVLALADVQRRSPPLEELAEGDRSSECAPPAERKSEQKAEDLDLGLMPYQSGSAEDH